MRVLNPYSEVQQVSPEEIVQRHGSLVRRIAYHLAARLPPSIQVEDLVQAGMAALLDATRTFDPGQGVPFEQYAQVRIRGGMLDELRRGDWTPRSVHRRERAIVQALGTLQASSGRTPTEQDVALAAGLSLDEYHEVLHDAARSRLVFFQELTTDQIASIADETTPEPSREAELRDLAQRLAEGIERLPEREQLVMALYYKEELNLREIGAVLGVTESRVSQIHGQALLRLRALLAPQSDQEGRPGPRAERPRSKRRMAKS